jgi:peroxiredoxin
LEALWRTRQNERFRVIGVNLSEPLERVKAYVTEMKLTFPIVIDTSGELAQTYGVRFTPTHFLIDRSGVVRAAGAGARDWNGAPAHAVVQVLLKATPQEPSKLPAQQDRADSPPTKGRTERR